MIKNVIEIDEHNLDEEVNAFKESRQEFTQRLDNESKCYSEKSRSETKPKRKKCSERTLMKKKNITVNARVMESYQSERNLDKLKRKGNAK